jgi:hypothetical protein
MRKLVTMPFTGQYSLEVDVPEGASDEDCIDAFYEVFESEGFDPHNMEWEFSERVAYGNVCEAMLNEYEIEDLD